MGTTRAERRTRTRRVVRQRVRYFQSHGDAAWRPEGTCRKRHPLDCGRTRCQLCHCDKLRHEPKPSDLRKALDPDA